RCRRSESCAARCWLARGCFFFFQAEDGIRDYKVTGVQTCALPILDAAMWLGGSPLPAHPIFQVREGYGRGYPWTVAHAHYTYREIGRASCREGWKTRGVACP